MSALPWWHSSYSWELELNYQWYRQRMTRQLLMSTPMQALAVLGLWRVWIVWYIFNNTDMEEGHWKQHLQPRSIYGYLLTFSTWTFSLDFVPLNYLLVLHRSQWGYFSPEVQSCTFTIQFYITDISITLLYLVILSTFAKASHWSGSEQDDTLECEGSPRTSPTAWFFRGYFL